MYIEVRHTTPEDVRTQNAAGYKDMTPEERDRDTMDSEKYVMQHQAMCGHRKDSDEWIEN